MLGDAAVRVVVDAYYSRHPSSMGCGPAGSTSSAVCARMPWGDDPEPRPPGTRGRKPRYGRKWLLASLLTAETPTRDRLTLYGQLTEVVFVVRDVWLRDVAQKVRFVVLEGAKEPSSWSARTWCSRHSRSSRSMGPDSRSS